MIYEQKINKYLNYNSVEQAEIQKGIPQNS